MGTRGSGRKPRPTHIRALEGVRESRLNRDEPIPTEAAIVPPVKLEPAAQAVWDRLAPGLIEARVLTAWDTDLFAVFCRSQALFNAAAAAVEAEGASTERPYKGSVPSPSFRVMVAMGRTVSSLGARFGLSPADRSTLRIENSGPKTNAEWYIT